MKTNNTTARQLRRGIAAIVLLLACLCATSLALIFASVRVNENLFETGGVQLNLNDGRAVINNIRDFEPGATLKRDFFLKNESTDSVYYKLYFDQISGGLADVIQVKITEKTDEGFLWTEIPAELVLYSGRVSELTRARVGGAGVLATAETREFSIFFHFPENAGNGAQDMTLKFTLCAEATQTRNNPNKEFD